MDDKEIIELLWQRKEQAIGELKTKYEVYCRAISTNILHCNEDVEECLNDALLAVWNSIPPNRPDSLKAYIGRIIRNRSVSVYRDRKRRLIADVEMESILNELSEVSDPSQNIENNIVAEELGNEISIFLKTQPKSEIKIFLLRYYYCFSIKDISQRCGKSVSSVNVSLFRIRKKLKKHLSEKGYL